MSELHLLVPDAVHDPKRPSGGNTYDRRLAAGLADLGWGIVEHLVSGGWPRPDAASRASLAAESAAVPDGATVLVDGLLASDSPDVIVPLAGRIRLVVLLHLATETAAEREVLGAAHAVVVTSTWARDRLVAVHGIDPSRVHVAEPGVEAGPLSPGTPGGGRLLTVAAVTPAKGHDVLVDALALLPADLDWHCTCVGPLTSDPAHAARVAERAQRAGVGDRLTFVGPLSPAALRARYAAHDLLVHPSLLETFGMVVTEALAHGLPVVASDVGGLPSALGGDGRAGVLVPPGDPEALAQALQAWLTDAGLRARLRDGARQRRTALTPWSRTAEHVAGALTPTPHVE